MHGSIQFEGIDEAKRVALANMPPRYRRLENLEAWHLGRQYDGRPSWWTGGPEEVPLWERAPCIVYPVVQIAINSNCDLVLGDERFPVITSRPGEDEDEEDDDEADDAPKSKPAPSDDFEDGLDEVDSETLDRFIREYHKLCRFTSHCREAFTAGQSSKTAVAIHGHRMGKPFAELIPAKWCTAQFDVTGNVLGLEVKYPYFEEYKDLNDHKWHVRTMLYRRVIDEQTDTTFLPGEANENGTDPKWIADPQRTVPHELGFCPVIWYAHMRGCAAINEIDGHAIHELQTNEIQAHDIALSSKHRCALLSEPQPTEIGVQPGTNPTAGMGRMANVKTHEHGEMTAEETTRRSGYFDPSPVPARKKGPGFVWQYPDKDTKVDYLVFPDGVLKGMQEHCDDSLEKIEAALGVVLPKGNQFKFAGSVSGRALQETRQRQYDRCDQYRDDLQDNFLIPSVNMQLRIAQKVRENLRVPGLKAVMPILDRFDEPDAQTNETSNVEAA